MSLFSFGTTKGTKSTAVSSGSSTPAPWSKGEGFLENFYKWAEAAGMREPSYYPGGTVAGMNPTLNMGLGNMVNSAWAAKATADKANAGWADMLQEQDISKNPHLRAAQAAMGQQMNADFGAQSGIMQSQFNAASKDLDTSLQNMYQGHQAYADVAQRRMTEDLLRDTLPRLSARAVGAGGLGGSRNALSQGMAVGDVGRALADYMTTHEAEYGQTARTGATSQANLGGQQAAAISGLGGQQAAALGSAAADLNLGAWSTMQGNRVAAMNAAPSIQGMNQLPSAMLMGAGGYQRDYEQKQIDADKARYDYYQNYPFYAADAMSNWYNRTIPFGSNQYESSYSNSKGGGGFNIGIL